MLDKILGADFVKEFGIKVFAKVLDEINSNEKVIESVKGLGISINELVPLDEVEPELAEFLELLKQGILEGKEEK